MHLENEEASFRLISNHKPTMTLEFSKSLLGQTHIVLTSTNPTAGLAQCSLSLPNVAKSPALFTHATIAEGSQVYLRFRLIVNHGSRYSLASMTKAISSGPENIHYIALRHLV